jgi:hypothetical protein
MKQSNASEAPQIWQDFREPLHRWGVKEFAASLLEALGPFTIVGANAAYVGQPILSSLLAPDKFQEMVRLLEEPDRTKAFVAYLREEDSL